MRRTTTALASLVLLAGTALVSTQAAAADFSLSYLGQQIVATGTPFQGTTVGGLSGIDYDATSGSYYAISDDRSALNPARFYNLNLDLNQFQRSATAGSAGVQFNSVTTIQKPTGGTYATNTVDPESIRYNAARGTLVWTNEGQRAAAGLQNPTVREMRLNGTHVRDYSVPGYYQPSGSVAGTTTGDRGIYNNLAFESLTFSTDGRTLYTATENGLTQDSATSAVNHGSRSRILSFDATTGQAGAEYAYDVSPVALPPNPADQFATNGLTDLLAIGERQFIGIERSFSTGAQTPGTPVTGNTIRLYYIDAREATDIAGRESIAGDDSIVAARKELLLDLSELRNDDGSALALDNIEGLTFGPEHNGKRTVVLVSDNNFASTQFTQFVALELAPVPEPSTWLLVIGGLCAMFGLRSVPRTPR